MITVDRFESKLDGPYTVADGTQKNEVLRDQRLVKREKLKWIAVWFTAWAVIPLLTAYWDWRLAAIFLVVAETKAYFEFRKRYYVTTFHGGTKIPPAEIEKPASPFDWVMPIGGMILGILIFSSNTADRQNPLLYGLALFLFVFGFVSLPKKQTKKPVDKKSLAAYYNADGTPRKYPPEEALRKYWGRRLVGDILEPGQYMVVDNPIAQLTLAVRDAPEFDMDVSGSAVGANEGSYNLVATLSLVLPQNPIEFRESFKVTDDKTLKEIMDNAMNQPAKEVVSGKEDTYLVKENRDFNPIALPVMIGRPLTDIELRDLKTGTASIYLPFAKAYLVQANFVVKRSEELQKLYDQEANEAVQAKSDARNTDTTLDSIQKVVDSGLGFSPEKARVLVQSAQKDIRVSEQVVTHQLNLSPEQELFAAMIFQAIFNKGNPEKDEDKKGTAAGSATK